MNILETQAREIAYLRSELEQLAAYSRTGKDLNKRLLVELAEAVEVKQKTTQALGEQYRRINTLCNEKADLLNRIEEQDLLLEDLTDIPEPSSTNAVQSHEQWLEEQKRQADPVPTKWSPEQEKLARERHNLITKDISSFPDRWEVRAVRVRGHVLTSTTIEETGTIPEKFSHNPDDWGLRGIQQGTWRSHFKPGLAIKKRPLERLAKLELDIKARTVVKSADRKTRNFWRWNK